MGGYKSDVMVPPRGNDELLLPTNEVLFAGTLEKLELENLGSNLAIVKVGKVDSNPAVGRSLNRGD